MHAINTIIGRVVAYPKIKATITKNTRIVSFFQSSHYWGGQLEIVAESKKVTRKLKTNTESRFYALILQALSVREHRQALYELCSREDAQRMIRGLTPIARDVVGTVFDVERWNLTDQLIRVCKPLVDIIGDIESRDATLADCMLQLIWAHRELIHMKLNDGEDQLFLDHARQVVNEQFHSINTDLHWLALFLHPLCRKLAISTATHSRKLDDAYAIAIRIVRKWKWSEDQARKLMGDIKQYYHGNPPFQGGAADGKDWWKSLVVSASTHPLKALAIKIFSIVPHAAEVERFFSNLGGVQSVKRSRLSIPHLETFGTLRTHYTRQLNEAAMKMGKSTRRKHAHIHTLSQPGIDTERVNILTENFTIDLNPQPIDKEFEDIFYNPEAISMDEIDAEFARLDDQATEDGDNLNVIVSLDQVYDLSELDGIRAGQVPITVEEELEIGREKDGSSKDWDEATLLRSLGIAF